MRKELGFVPIAVEEYIKLHVKNNRDENPADLLRRFRICIGDAMAGARCQCGQPIWVIGSTFAGHACFTCITGEAHPDADYEIDEVLDARRATLADPGVQASGKRR